MRPSQRDVLMQMAEAVSARGTCNRRQVGAVLALDGRVLSHGYNGAPRGLPHCGDECYTGGPQCSKSVHAEVNAIIWAARIGVRVEGSEAYITLNPCEPCAGLLINAGVQRVWYREFYKSTAGNDLLVRAGIPCKQL